MRYSTLVKGNPCGLFGSSKGLRQGDPLSPTLFILVMEALSRIMDKVVLERYKKGFNAAIGDIVSLSASHLLFLEIPWFFVMQMCFSLIF